MNKKILLIGLVLFLLSVSSAFAVDPPTDATASWNFEVDGSTITDNTGTGWDLTKFGTPIHDTTNFDVGLASFDFDPQENLQTATTLIDGTSDFTIQMRLKPNDATPSAHAVAISSIDSNAGFYFSIVSGGSNIRFQCDSAQNDWSNPFSDGTWSTAFFEYDDTAHTITPHIDGSSLSAKSCTISDSGVVLKIGSYSTDIIGWDGNIDQVMVYERKLTSDERIALSGDVDPYDTPPIVESDEVIRQVIELEQTANVTINSDTYQDIFSSTFEVLNDTVAYMTWAIELDSLNKDTIGTCRAVIDDIDYNTEINRTLLNGQKGNLYIASTEFNLSATGTRTVKLQCHRDSTGGAQVEISNALGIINIMDTLTGENINYENARIPLTLNSTSYVKLFETNFTTSNLTGGGLELSLISDGAIQYEYVNNATISLYAVLEGEQTATFERYGEAGSTGTGAGLYITKNVTPNANITFEVWGKSTSGNGEVLITTNLAENFAHEAETTIANLTGINPPKTPTWTTISTIYINNTNHATSDIIAKASFGAQDDSGFTPCFQNYRIKAGSTFSPEYMQEVSANATVVTVQHIMSNPGLVNQSIELQTSNDCVASNNNELTNGGFMAYLADEINAVPQFYRITAQDEANSTVINTFNVTLGSGSFFQTVSGFVDIYHVNGFDDFNVTAENYETNITINHDTTTNLTVNMRPLPLEDFTLLTPNNSFATGDSFNITWTQAVSPTQKVVTYEVIVSFDHNGTIVNAINTTDLNYTLNLTGFLASNYNVSVTANEADTGLSFVHSSILSASGTNYLYFFNEQTGNPIVDANITVYFPNLPGSSILVTDAEGKVEFDSFQNGTLQTGDYNITFEDYDGFVSPLTFARTYNQLPVNESFNITVTNINVTVLYRTNGTLFDKTATVIIEGVANFTVTNGSVFIQNATIISGTYRVTVSSPGYFNEEKTFTFTGQEDLDLGIYMLQINESNSGTVNVRTLDEFSRLLSGAQVNLLEYDTSTLSYIEVSECFTDSNGECKFLIETNTKSYKFTASKVVDGVLITTTDDTPRIFEDDISGGEVVLFSEETVVLNLNSIEQYILNPITNIAYDITESFNNVSNVSNIAVSFRSLDGTNIQVCVEYFEIVGGTEQSKTGDTFCVVTSSAELTENAFFTLNTTKEYIAKVYIKEGTSKIILESFRYKAYGSFEDILRNQGTLPAIVLLIWLFIIAGGVALKNVSVTGVGIIVGAWVLVFMFPTIMITSIAVLQSILGLSLVYVGRKKEDFE